MSTVAKMLRPVKGVADRTHARTHGNVLVSKVALIFASTTWKTQFAPLVERPGSKGTPNSKVSKKRAVRKPSESDDRLANLLTHFTHRSPSTTNGPTHSNSTTNTTTRKRALGNLSKSCNPLSSPLTYHSHISRCSQTHGTTHSDSSFPIIIHQQHTCGSTHSQQVILPTTGSPCHPHRTHSTSINTQTGHYHQRPVLPRPQWHIRSTLGLRPVPQPWLSAVLGPQPSRHADPHWGSTDLKRGLASTISLQPILKATMRCFCKKASSRTLLLLTPFVHISRYRYSGTPDFAATYGRQWHSPYFFGTYLRCSGCELLPRD
jgi:hypothetical protein